MHTILVADDSVTIQLAVEIAFNKEPFHVVKAGSGAEAIARARDAHASLVLADHQMPDKTGYEVAEALRADPATAQIPVLILTSNGAPYDEARGRAAGAVGNIQKPFDCQSLLERVRTVLGVPAGAAVPTGIPVTSAAPVSAAVAATPRPPGFGATSPSSGLPRPPGAAPAAAGFPRPATTSPMAQPIAAAAVPLARAATPLPDRNVDPFGFGASMGTPRPSAANPFANPPSAAQPAAIVSAGPPSAAPANSPLAGFGASPFHAASQPALSSTPPPAARVEPSFDITFDDGPAKPATPVASAVLAVGAVSSSSPPRTGSFVEAEFLEVADVDIAEIAAAPTIPPVPAQTLPPTLAPTPAPSAAPPRTATPGATPAPPMARAPTPVASSMADVGRITSKVDLQRLASLDAAGAGGKGIEIATTAVVERAQAILQTAPSSAAAPSKEALTAEAREIIERIAWEVVPELAETIIREEIQRLLKSR